MANSERKLNVEIEKNIATLQDMIKEFKLKKDIFRILFRGKGLEFDGYRSFSPDDNAEDIDWKASSRTQSLIVKRYKEERDLKIMFLIDVGTSMVFGSTDKIKCEYTAELSSALANLIITANDRIGFLFFSDKITNFVGFKGGFKHFNLFVDLVTRGENYGGNTNLNKALDFATEYLDSSVMSTIIISDFLSVNNETEKKINLLASRFEVIALRVRDPLDLTLPDIEGEIILEDPATLDQTIINPKVASKSYQEYAKIQSEMVEKIFKKLGIDFLDFITSEPFALPLALFLKERIDKKF